MALLTQVSARTVVFFKNKTVWRFFLPSQIIVSLALSVLVAFFPFFSLAETAELEVRLNPLSISVFLLVFPITALITMVEVMRVIFYGEEMTASFIPVPNRDVMRFSIKLIENIAVSLVAGVAIAYFGLYALKTFLKLPPVGIDVVAAIAVMVAPYCMIRQSMSLTATVANDDAGLGRSWRLTGKCGMSLCLFYLFFMFFPLLLFLLTVSFLKFPEAVNNFLALMSLFFSAMTQAAFLSYLYIRLKDEA